MDNAERSDSAPTDMAEHLEPPVADAVARRIWENYFRDVRRLIRPLPKAQQRELIVEIYGHVQASMAVGGAEREAERVLDAFDKLGRPTEYIRPIVADRMLEQAADSLNPLTIAKGLGLSLFRGVAYTVAAFGFLVGYLTVLVLTLIAFAKPFFPDQVGAYTHPGGFSIGFLPDGVSGQAVEHLGYALIPICLLAAGALYIGLTKLLRLLKSRRKSF